MSADHQKERYVLVGCTGSGKTTISQKLGLPHIELVRTPGLKDTDRHQDALNWEANWTPAPDFVDRVHQVLQDKEEWIVDGNNEKVRDYVWSIATTVIWLNYPFYLIMWRLFVRTMRRLIFAEPLWNGNKERWSVVFSWNSILLWGITMYFYYRKLYTPELFKKFPKLKVLIFTSPQEAQHWLERLYIQRKVS